MARHLLFLGNDDRHRFRKGGMMEEERITWDAFQIIELEGEKSFWRRIGVGFSNRDRSINILLDAFPKDGKFQLRDRRAQTNRKEKYNEDA